MKRGEFLARLHLIAFAFALLSLGFLGSQFVSALRSAAPIPVSALSEESDAERSPGRLPVVVVEEMRGGKLQGRVRGNVRLFVGNEVVRILEDGTFAAEAAPLLTNIETVLVPPWAKFVASRRGKKYYDVTSSAAGKLVPPNRIYFRSAEEAEAAGYSR